MRRVLAGVFVCGSIASGLALADGTTALREARATYGEIQASLKSGSLTKRVREFEYCQPYEDGTRTLYSTRNGIPRLYERQAGSDDSSVTWMHYYDGTGKLRFVLIAAGAVNGTHLEHRIWFSEEGRRVKEQARLIAGPGYTFANPWPDEDIAHDATRAFEAPNRCTEIKVR